MIDDEIETDLECIKNHITLSDSKYQDIKIKTRIEKEFYCKKVSTILDHIHLGDLYEANFCVEFYADNTAINPYKVYSDLNEISTPPFATFIRVDEHYLLSASPERYLKRKGTKLFHSPSKELQKELNDVDDQHIAHHLANDQKERSENIMIVDLVRNDLSKTAEKGSVQVEELCRDTHSTSTSNDINCEF